MTHSQLTFPFAKFEVLPNLFLSRFPKEIPQEITHILNMCTAPHPPDSSRIYLHIALDDIDNIKPHIPKIISFIGQALKNGGKLLVHCALGLNQSVAAILTYICNQNQINSSEALKLVKLKNPDVKPCALFLKQIDQFFGREEDKEDPLVGFRRRLQERKTAALAKPPNE